MRPFYDHLIAEVNRFAADVYAFFDKTASSRATAVDSAVLVPVLSPRFFDSDYSGR